MSDPAHFTSGPALALPLGQGGGQQLIGAGTDRHLLELGEILAAVLDAE